MVFMGCGGKAAFVNPDGAGNTARRCVPTGATIAADLNASSRVTWTVELLADDGATPGMGRIDLDWEQHLLPNGRAVVGELCWRSTGVPKFLAIDVTTDWVVLYPENRSPRGELALTISVRGPRPISKGVDPPTPDDAFAHPFGLIRRTVEVLPTGARFLSEGQSDFQDFEFETDDGMIELIGRCGELQIESVEG